MRAQRHPRSAPAAAAPPTAVPCRQYADFLTGPALAEAGPRIGSLAAALAAPSDAPSNDQDAVFTSASSTKEPWLQVAWLADLLAVRPTALAVQRTGLAHLGVAVSSAAHQTVNVVLPFINQAVGGDVVTFANITAGSSTLNLVGGVVMGTIFDWCGTKSALLLVHSSALVTSLIVATAPSVPVLYLSALPFFFMHGFQVSMQVASRQSESDARATALGRIAIAHGVALLSSGVIVTASLRTFAPRQIAGVAVVAEAGLVLVLAALYPSDTAHADVAGGEAGEEAEACSEVEPRGNRAGLLRVLLTPGVLPVLAFQTALNAAGGSVVFMAQQFAVDPFGFSPHQVAMLMAYSGLLQIASQTLVFDDVDPRPLCWGTATFLGAGLVGMGLASPSPWAFVFWLAPVNMVLCSGNVMISSLLTRATPQAEMGTALGLNVATVPAGQLVAVTVAARVYRAHGFAAVPLLGAGLLFAAAAAFDAVMPGMPLDARPARSPAVAPAALPT
ncbi:unnamed protein product [Prorocentrum cordatum]|uniref:Solute carrier family 40 protein n=1 Tax=Prorocentrum cordatum TaxID=2364126 RepID=A0ABN9U1L6_9DINO|nr:unnamed protein product [Polarella glacialis]